MTTYDILRRARRNLTQARVRTILTSLAIAVGAFTVTLALAAGEGGRQYTEEMMKTSGDGQSLSVYPKRVEVKANELTEYGAVNDSSVSDNTLNNTDIEKIKTVAGVVDIVPMYNIQPRYVTRGGNFKKYIAPVNIKVDRTEMKLAAGSLEDNKVPVGGISISEELLSSFGFTDAESAIGQTLTINMPKIDANGKYLDESINKTLKIIAVDHSTDATLYYQPGLYISIDDGKELYDYQIYNNVNDQYNGVVVELKSGTDIKTVQAAIADKGYDVYSLQDTRETLLQMVNIAQWGMVAFGALAILASIFGIINTQYISVLERTQQIGLMKALGARKKDIARLFRYEAAWVGFLGGMSGTILAFLVGFANPLIAEKLHLERGVRLLVFNPITSIMLIIIMMAIAIAAGYFPSRKAAKLNPIEALRTE
ncbi:MAG: putative transport system permease protein [Patescibacteria group bacterium]|nr:putative transport system permease protein [Patescibacteria group bacterium]